eukprot:scaffold244336_cov18-Tisochrysis_lutea.AAC.1
MSGLGAARAQWNAALLRHVATDAYISLLEAAKTHLGPSLAYASLWPSQARCLSNALAGLGERAVRARGPKAARLHLKSSRYGTVGGDCTAGCERQLGPNAPCLFLARGRFEAVFALQAANKGLSPMQFAVNERLGPRALVLQEAGLRPYAVFVQLAVNDYLGSMPLILQEACLRS